MKLNCIINTLKTNLLETTNKKLLEKLFFLKKNLANQKKVRNIALRNF